MNNEGAHVTMMACLDFLHGGNRLVLLVLYSDGAKLPILPR